MGLSNDYGCAVVVMSHIENLYQLITIIPANNFLFQPTTIYPTTLTGHDVIIIRPRFVSIDEVSKIVRLGSLLSLTGWSNISERNSNLIENVRKGLKLTL